MKTLDENNLSQMIKQEVILLNQRKEWKKLQGLHLKLCLKDRIGSSYPWSYFGFTPSEIKFWEGVREMGITLDPSLFVLQR